jgi:L-ascorbate metabolism protein UlaG (beta-lactamase superfamily)
MEKKTKNDITLRWMGTAAFEICYRGKTLLIDPFASRPSLWRVAAGRPIPSDESETERRFPRANIILIGHSHFDHLMDAPSIARRTGAVIAGSTTACFIAESMGVPKKSLFPQADPPSPFRLSGFDIKFIPSLHGRVVMGRVPYPGILSSIPPKPPVKASDYILGHVYGLHLRAGGISLYHNGSADLIDDNLRGLKADILLLGLAGRFKTRDYVKRMISALEPHIIIPCHYDWFFTSLDTKTRHLPGIKLGHFIREVHDVNSDIRIIVPGIGSTVELSKSGGRCSVK